VWSERISSSSICIIAVLISKLCVCAQAQQLQGRFYSEADSYIVGGPVLFNLEIKNTGSEDVYLHAKNPSGRLDTYAFSVQRRTLRPVAQTGMPNTRCGVCIKTGGIGTGAVATEFLVSVRRRRRIRSECYRPHRRRTLVRIQAIEGLGHSGDASDQTLISGYLEDKDGPIQLAAMVAIA